MMLVNEDCKELKEDSEKGNILSRENLILLSSSVILGIAFDILFYGKALGVSYPLFIIAFYTVFLFNAKSKLVKPQMSFEWLLTLPVLALALTYFIFSNEIFQVLNFFAVPLLVIIQTTLLTSNSRYKWYSSGFILDIILGAFARPLVNIAKPFAILSKAASSKLHSTKYRNAGKVLMGLLVSVSLALIVVPLLASADQVFNSFVENIPDFFTGINAGDFIAQVLVVLVACILLFSYILSLIKPEECGLKPSGELGASSPARPLDAIMVITVLCVMNIIYLVFTAIQFSYLFSHSSLPEGFTYSEYARRGFFELLLVTVINLSIVLCNINFTKKSGVRMGNANRILSSLLILCTAVMLLSAHLRMSLYEDAYGYTYLRIFTHAFMVFIFVLLIIALFKIWHERVPLLKAYIITAIAAYVIINYINVDSIVARNNIERYKKSSVIDTMYLTGLSYDAMPYLMGLVYDSKEDISEEMKKYLSYREKELLESRDWQSFNISRYRAERLISKYTLNYDQKETE